MYQSLHTFDEKWFDEGVGENQWSFNGKTGCPQVKLRPKYCTKLFLKDYFLYTGWGQEKNVRKGSRSCPPPPIYIYVLEGQKACYIGQILYVWWSCRLINLFFSSEAKTIKSLDVLQYIKVHISLDILLYLKVPSGNALINPLSPHTTYGYSISHV